MAIAIKAENLSKAYQLGEFSTGTVSRDIERWLARIRGKEDPFLKVGEVNDRTVKGNSDVVWSLKDIDFEIQEGDAVGIIGRNGAGKSTLLKILSRVTTPTTGIVKARGRIASLLEVGTGFHPELTGRENIYLNGAILGMRKKEIDRKLDKIVDFSGVERYLDTPVKRFSSGMYVRLAFAVAAHLESQILIVDEVLAVGDAEFQKKCLGKMKDIGVEEGRTVLFVSHNMGMISQLCNSAILLEYGKVVKIGKPPVVLDEYIQRQRKMTADAQLNNPFVTNMKVTDEQGVENNDFLTSDEIFIRLAFDPAKMTFPIMAGIAVLDVNESKVFTTITQIESAIGGMRCVIPARTLTPGKYSLDFSLFNGSMTIQTYIDNICPFRIIDGGTELAAFEGVNYGRVFVNCKWNAI
ncbi:MAG TPA: polysaccharide ABC transporter ATP-binding protein [Puia sp.]|nr:polysaccharide ABC transporter ATP-binding protein [Puia sp.]